uniref:Uncharacterized protein n=1 Tax=Pinctada fucata TaxID=50426 RepID=A0A194ANF6_PINFU
MLKKPGLFFMKISTRSILSALLLNVTIYSEKICGKLKFSTMHSIPFLSYQSNNIPSGTIIEIISLFCTPPHGRLLNEIYYFCTPPPLSEVLLLHIDMESFTCHVKTKFEIFG